MKRFLTFILIALVVFYALSGCGSGGEKIDYNLVFVNNSDATIVEVVADFVDRDSGVRNADSSPLKRGETFGFEAGEYPVTVLVYDTAVGRIEEGELARIVISKAPPEGERWYVTAQDGTHGIVLTADTERPAGA
ncbi:MAG: hypothetical protein K2M15_04270 [Oscillospiraceae bacterium]|nr:hypothetical protein [Oscillospiraceae bacterium]MDE7170469.1 hypothetical protein [Oscillospiraceae bacterium]